MAELDIKDVRERLNKDGFAVEQGTLTMVERAIALDGVMQAVTQRGRKVTTLVPYGIENAPPGTLSAVYGLDEQPLHTDGAHLPDPPDVIVLHSATENNTPTAIWKRPSDAPWYPEFVTHGVFSVRGNEVTFLASALEGSNLRFDPVCMSPGDSFAKEAVNYFAGLRTSAQLHEWNAPNLLLFIDNRHVLHARQKVDSETDVAERKVSRLALTFKETS